MPEIVCDYCEEAVDGDGWSCKCCDFAEGLYTICESCAAPLQKKCSKCEKDICEECMKEDGDDTLCEDCGGNHK